MDQKLDGAEVEEETKPTLKKGDWVRLSQPYLNDREVISKIIEDTDFLPEEICGYLHVLGTLNSTNYSYEEAVGYHASGTLSTNVYLAHPRRPESGVLVWAGYFSLAEDRLKNQL